MQTATCSTELKPCPPVSLDAIRIEGPRDAVRDHDLLQMWLAAKRSDTPEPIVDLLEIIQGLRLQGADNAYTVEELRTDLEEAYADRNACQEEIADLREDLRKANVEIDY